MMNGQEAIGRRFHDHVAAFSMSLGSSANLSGIVGSDYVNAQQDIEKALLRNVNEIMGNRGRKIDRISELVTLVQFLVDSKDTAERKLRIANDKIVDLELSGVVSPGQNEGLLSAQILHAQLQRRESELAEAVDEIERLSEQLEAAREEERNLLDIANKERDRMAFLYSEKDKSVFELEKKIQLLQTDMKSKDAELALKDREVKAAEAKTQQVSAEALAEIDFIRKESSRKIRQLEIQLTETESEKLKNSDNYTFRITDLERQIAKLTAELRERKNTPSGSIVSIQEKVEISAMQDECARQRRKIIELESTAQRHRQEMESMKLRVKESEDSSEKAVETKNEAIRQLEAQNQEILERLSSVSSEKKELEKNRDQLATTVNSLNTDIELLQDIMTAIRTQSEQIAGENSKLKFKLENKDKEIGRLRETAQEFTINNARTQLGHAELELVTLKADREKLSHSLREAEVKIHELSTALEASVVERAHIAGVAESLSSESAMLQKTLAQTTLELREQVSTLEQALGKSESERGALHMRIKALESEFKKTHAISPGVGDTEILDEIIVAISAIRDGFKQEHSKFTSQLAEANKQLKSVEATLAEKEKLIAELQDQLKVEELVAPAILIDDDEFLNSEESTVLRQEIEIACTELRSLIENAGWPLSNEEESLGGLVSVVRANVLAAEDFYGNQLREMELDIDYLRAKVETERMIAEDTYEILRSAAERSSRIAVEENSKRKVLQESALELAEKTTVLWNKYRAASSGTGMPLTLPPFSK